MADPVLELYEAGSSRDSGVLISSSSQLSFGLVPAGTNSAVKKFDVWNDRNGIAGSDDATPQMNAFGSSVFDDFFAGTEVNGNLSMLEARSCGADGIPGDYQTAWTPIRPDTFLAMGLMPSNTKRTIELRVRVPYDADTFALDTPNLMLHF